MVSSANILVVDDDAAVRFFLKETLARQGYDVTAVESGEAALACCERGDFAVVLLDLKMEGMGGMEVLTELARQWPDTEVIVLTGHASLETAVRALRHGAHDYLFKPCKTVELRESVRSALVERTRKMEQQEVLSQLKHSLKRLEKLGVTDVGQTPPPTAEAVPAEEEGRFIQQGDLIVDTMRHVITLEGHLLELSPTEFDLLAYLISEHPRVVSPEELMREAQGYKGELWGASSAVRSHIYRIRQKIEKATERTDVISTVRGVGYALEP